MAEIKRRPRIKAVETKVVRAGVEEVVRGPDLDDVLKGVLCALRNQSGGSTRALARSRGVPPQTINGLLDDTVDTGARVTTLTRICAALDCSIGELFGRHPKYADADQVQHPLWGTLSQHSTPKQLEMLARLVLLAQQLGIQESVIEQSLTMVESMATAQGIDTDVSKTAARDLARGVG